MQITPDNVVDDEVSHVALLDVECTMQFMMEKGITTATFVCPGTITKSFEELESIVRARIQAICEVSPWITARLVKNKKLHKNVLMKFSTRPTVDDLDAVFQSVKIDCPLARLSRTDGLETILKTVAKSSAVVASGSSLIGKDGRVCKFTLIKSSETDDAEDGFRAMLIASLSHAVADGYTYYQLFSQISLEREIVPLSPIRKEIDAALCRNGAGSVEYDWQFKPSLLINIVGSAIRGVNVQPFARLIDTEKLAAAKSAVMSASIPDGQTSSSAAKYVSTNDILTSAFGRATASRILLMAINWRGRLGSLTPQDAGNYESAVLFDPESYSDPRHIRSALQCEPVVRLSDRPLPGCCEAMQCRFSMITSWVFPSYSGELELSPGSRVLLHLPIYLPSEALFNVGVIFRPRKNELAILCFASRGLTAASLETAGAPLGDPVIPFKDVS